MHPTIVPGRSGIPGCKTVTVFKTADSQAREMSDVTCYRSSEICAPHVIINTQVSARTTFRAHAHAPLRMTLRAVAFRSVACNILVRQYNSREQFVHLHGHPVFPARRPRPTEIAILHSSPLLSRARVHLDPVSSRIKPFSLRRAPRAACLAWPHRSSPPVLKSAARRAHRALHHCRGGFGSGYGCGCGGGCGGG